MAKVSIIFEDVDDVRMTGGKGLLIYTDPAALTHLKEMTTAEVFALAIWQQVNALYLRTLEEVGQTPTEITRQ